MKRPATPPNRIDPTAVVAAKNPVPLVSDGTQQIKAVPSAFLAAGYKITELQLFGGLVLRKGNKLVVFELQRYRSGGDIVGHVTVKSLAFVP